MQTAMLKLDRLVRRRRTLVLVAWLACLLAALPFALRSLAPALAEIEARHGRLADSLGITGAARLRIVVLPLLRPALGFAGGLAAALSPGRNSTGSVCQE